MSDDFAALLIGVPTYEDSGIADLPFIENDLAELEVALRDAGYHVTVNDCARTDAASIEQAVEFFLADALPDQHVLIFLSGHGVHNQAMDYLVPYGAHTRSYDFPSRCIPISFGPYIERSRCGNVLVVVDACREGISMNDMSVNVASWSKRKVERVGSRLLAYMYACSPAERARYTTVGTTTFSLFSRAFSEALNSDLTPVCDLAALESAVQEGVDALTSENQLPRQQIRVVSDATKSAFPIRRTNRAETEDVQPDHPWVVAAATHSAWSRVGGQPLATELRAAAISVTRTLARRHGGYAGGAAADPWRDETFALRMTEKSRWLVSSVLNPDKLSLTPAEALLLVVFPFARESLQAIQFTDSGALKPSELDHQESNPRRAAYEQFLSSQGRLVRRARHSKDHGDIPSSQAIGWWMYRKWLSRQLHAYDGPNVSRILADAIDTAAVPHEAIVRSILDPERLSRMLFRLRLAPTVDATADRRRDLNGSVLISPTTEYEQPLRESLLSYLLLICHRFAIDLDLLPEVVAEHVGITYPVLPGDVVKTISTAVWEPRGRTRVLHAKCSHPAIDLALRRYTQSLDAVLGVVEEAAGEVSSLVPLQDVPTHATADRVVPAPLPDGKRAYDSIGFRFRLDDERVQELLMGENLYGDPALAIRELYQNALDACRYRDARLRYLRATENRSTDWVGAIQIRQGVTEDGRPFIDCIDNGVGMGMRELTDVFSRAGVRFADLPDFAEEELDWSRVGINMHPNSRFGIGVLSYFMVADDFTVTTRHMDRSGRAGDALEVHIPGPGALFRVRNLGEVGPVGTRVRLHLRSEAIDLSAVDLLRKILWVSDFSVEVADATDSLTLAPGQLSQFAPIGGIDEDWTSRYTDISDFENDEDSAPYYVSGEGDPTPHFSRGGRRRASRVDVGVPGLVWWCDRGGALLADGIWSGLSLPGVIVNLTGAHAPQLTVDRRRILTYDKSALRQLLLKGVSGLVSANATVLTHEWLGQLSEVDILLADEIWSSLIQDPEKRWTVGGYEVSPGKTGFFAEDSVLFSTPGGPSGQSDPLKTGANSIGDLPEPVAAWRFQAWASSGYLDAISSYNPTNLLVGRPSDRLLWTMTPKARQPAQGGWEGIPANVKRGLAYGARIPVAHLAHCALRTGYPLGQLIDRVRDIGLELEPAVRIPDHAMPGDDVILSVDLDRAEPWIWTITEVPLGHIVAAAIATGLGVPHVVDRLQSYGCAVPSVAHLPAVISLQDTVLLSQDWNGRAPWRDLSRPVDRRGLALAALRLGGDVASVIIRMARLGLILEDGVGVDLHVEDEDKILASIDRDGMPPWVGAEVSVGHVANLSARLRLAPARVSSRLSYLGFDCPEDHLILKTTSLDLKLLSRSGDGRPPWYSQYDRVGVGHIMEVARSTGATPSHLCLRARAWGLQVPEQDPQLSWDDVPILAQAYAPEGEDNVPQKAPRWLAQNQSVPLGHIAYVAQKFDHPPPYVARRLGVLGFRLNNSAVIPHRFTEDDLALLSLNATGFAPWIGWSREIPWGHIVSLSLQWDRPISDIAGRLMAFGFKVPNGATRDIRARNEDLVLLSTNFDGKAPWAAFGATVPYSFVYLARLRALLEPAVIEERLRAYQIGIEAPTGTKRDIRGEDAAWLSQHLNDLQLAMQDRELPLEVLFGAASARDWSLGEAIEFFRSFGVRTPGIAKADVRPRLEDVALVRLAYPFGRYMGLFRASRGAGREVSTTARRLSQLGLPVPAPLDSLFGPVS